jgi:ubiquinone/menaquinone biosynthesis C-methylase UbiE
LPFLERERFRGSVVEVDLAAPMLARALALHARLAPAFETVFLRSDALDLPLRNAVADVVVSINGLHVVDDHSRFLSEIARVTKAGGKLWLITPVDGESIRSRLILAAANAIGVTPRTPPSRPALLELVHAAGFTVIRDYGGSSIAGFAAEKR